MGRGVRTLVGTARGRAVALAAVLLVVYLPGWWLFLGREDDPLRPADAVVVLAGSTERFPVAIRLIRSGVAPTLILSADTSGFDPVREAICAYPEVVPAEVACLQSVPFSTRGEARMVSRIAEERGWTRIVLVTSRFHLLRAERIFRRCTEVEIVARGAPEPVVSLLRAIPLEWAKWALAGTLRRNC